MSAAPLQPETFAACLTPAGTGAIATVAVRGPLAWQAVRRLFRGYSTASRPLPADPHAGSPWLGRLGEVSSTSAADEVVLTVKRTAPFAWVEIHCHGGQEVVRWILEILRAEGVRVCSSGELEARVTEDPAQTAAAAALVQAQTVRTAAILLDQYHGAFRRAVHEALAALDCGDIDRARVLLNALAAHADLGRHLTAPWKVAILGAPNVGKSSLVNALAGYQRSVVAATPGTTRDVVTTLISVHGWLVELSDTAGLREATGSIEAQGLARAQTAAASADLCLWVLEASAPPVWPRRPLPSMRLVLNKTDLPPAWDLTQAGGAVHISARTGQGIDTLCNELAGWLVPVAPPPGVGVPFSPDVARAVEQARADCVVGRVAEGRAILVHLWS
ncbi:MAG TPA: GTPase [Gemmataceae bacterium]|nr:GTPase [Gemmataceae bacterium]